MSPRCTWPQGCARTTKDPSGRCQDHRGAQSPPRTAAASRVGTIPTPADPSLNSVPVIHQEQRYAQLPIAQRYNGGVCWWLKGVRHREDGPAVVYTSGTKEWYIHGQLHREDGPAVVQNNGTKEWHVNGERVSGTLCQKLLRQGLSLLWHDWDEGLREELVAAGVTPERANEVYAAGVTKPEGLRQVLIQGVPLEWVLVWEQRQK